ncbi:hypothetical protein [Nocardia wallacei]|uniref:hypothetical protein n=1 Tax=Nocardia wallacei TaxID=480035 RepID=UPI002458FBE4|nr:hypothetical protein [Nocardia wallacei]
MSAWEYRSKAEELMAEYRFLDPSELAEELADAGYIQQADQEAATEAIGAHYAVHCYDDDDPHCQCGKWLEDDEYEWPDHIGDVLDQWLTEAGKADR